MGIPSTVQYVPMAMRKENASIAGISKIKGYTVFTIKDRL